MIRSFKHKGLKELFLKGTHSGVQPDMAGRIQRRLDVFDVNLEDYHGK